MLRALLISEIIYIYRELFLGEPLLIFLVIFQE